jgi:hypothetical protein
LNGASFTNTLCSIIVLTKFVLINVVLENIFLANFVLTNFVLTNTVLNEVHLPNVVPAKVEALKILDLFCYEVS